LTWAILAGVILGFLFIHLKNPFYADDYFHLAVLKFMQDPSRVIWKYFFGQSTWRPLVLCSDYLCLKLFGLQPFGWHLSEVVLHSLNALLVSVLAYLLFEGASARWRKFASLLAGLFFAIHPLALLTTAWIACRADLMATFFSLLAVILLLSAQKSAGWRGLKSGAAAGLALIALFSKESALALPFAAGAVLLFFPENIGAKQRRTFSALALIILLSVLGIYFLLRVNVVGSLQGYDPVEFRAGFILPRLWYHLPKVLWFSLQDYLFEHQPRQSIGYKILFWAYIAFALAALLPALRKPKYVFTFVLWTLFTLVPIWNLSHMFAYGEARLLYLGLVGAALVFSSSVFLSERKPLRGAVIAAALVILAMLGVRSVTALSALRERSQSYEKLKNQVMQIIAQSEDHNHFKRLYIYGLDVDFYGLDPMFKVAKPEWLDRIIVPAGIPSLTWIDKAELDEYKNDYPMLPRLKVQYTDQKTALATVAPPEDLIQAVVNDPQALVLEWKNGWFEEILPEITQLSHERRFMQATYAYRMMLFPTFSFRKRSYPFDWKLSPGLDLITPEQFGRLYTFESKNDDPYLVSPGTVFLAIPTAFMRLRMRIGPRKYLAPQEQEGCLSWMTEKDTDWQAHQKVCFSIQADGKEHDYELHLDRNLYWLRSNTISRLRLDPISFRGRFWIDSLIFSPVAEPE